MDRLIDFDKIDRLQKFMAWFYNEFPYSNYQADYTGNDTRIIVSRNDQYSFLTSYPVRDCIAKANELNLSIFIQVRDNKPEIEIQS